MNFRTNGTRTSTDAATRSADREVLARARRLGYLKVAHASDPAVDAYLAWCLRHSRPAVVLSPDRRHPHLAVIEYRFPSPDHCLDEHATESIRRWSMALSAARLRRPSIIAPGGGEIAGLLPARAEELAFRIADAALDCNRTKSWHSES